MTEYEANLSLLPNSVEVQANGKPLIGGWFGIVDHPAGRSLKIGTTIIPLTLAGPEVEALITEYESVKAAAQERADRESASYERQHDAVCRLLRDGKY